MAMPVGADRDGGIRRSSALLAAVGLVLSLLAAAPATAQVEALGELPPEIADRDQRAILRAERERLRIRLRSLQRTAGIFNGECGSVRRGSAQHRACAERYRSLEGERASYDRDAKAFNAKVAAAVARSPGKTSGPLPTDPAQVEGGTRAALAAANRKTGFLLDALHFGATNWKSSIAYLEDRLSDDPGDRDLRGALDYLRGMYQGHLAAEDLSNRYYRYGVRRALAGEHGKAARAFARAARDNPDDLKAYRSFAHAVGRQHESPACRQTHDCVAGSLPRWASFFGPEHEIHAAALRAALRRDPARARLRRVLDLLDGMAVYAAEAPSPPSVSDRAHALAGRAIRRTEAGDWLGAARFYGLAWHESGGERSFLFLKHYAEGRADARGRFVESEVIDEEFKELFRQALDRPAPPGARAPADGGAGAADYARRAFASFKAAMRDVARHSPFFGRLSPAETAALGDRP